MRICPNCKSNQVRSSQARSALETIFRKFCFCMYKCDMCNWRGMYFSNKKLKIKTKNQNLRTLVAVILTIIVTIMIFLLIASDM